MSVPFEEWAPDLADKVLTVASNVRAIADGYTPVKAQVAVTSALAAKFNGGGAYISSTGLSSLLAATPTAVYKYGGSSWSSAAAMASTTRTRFAQFGDNVLIAGGGQLWHYDLVAGTAGAVATAPSVIDVEQVRDFVMAITTDNKVQWSDFNDSLTWTPGTNQADYQPSLWGQARKLIGGEYGMLLTDSAVVRITYVGSLNDIIFQFDEISAEIGCITANSVTHVGRMIFFISERGFEMCDGNEVIPIADEKFNRWFFDKYSRADIANVWAAIDPRNSVVLWAMPGTPGTIIAYNWVLKKATTFEMPVSGMFTGYTSGLSLDGLDAIYGNLDAVPFSLDSPALQGGNPILLIADGANKLTALTGDNLEATIKLENIEPTPGRRSRVRTLRLVTDSNSASATLDARMNAGDTEAIRSTSTMRSNGKLPIRANGRYNTLDVTIPAGVAWSYIQGAEIEFEAGDAR